MSIGSHNEPSAIEVYLMKCNWYGKGVKVYVGHCELVHLCPVTAVRDYDRQRPEPSSEMRQALLTCGVDQTVYSSHSFMIGAAINSTS